MQTHKPETRTGPSVVARLMGMDSVPPGRTTVIDAKESKVPKKPAKSSNTIIVRRDSISTMDLSSPRSAPFRQTKCNLLSYNNNNNNYNTNSKRAGGGSHRGRPPCQHPQEEVLQKFKREFQAWQASKVLEKSKEIVLENGFHKGKYVQILAQEKLNKEKMAKYAETNKTNNLKIVIPEKKVPETKNETRESDCKKENCERPSSSATRIVILKPTFETTNNPIISRDSRLSSSNSKKDCSMEDFLEEVKERLKLEIESTKYGNRNRNGNGIRSNDPKQIARDIAKQIRESVTKDMNRRLTRSQSFKHYNYSPDSPEFIRRDTRRIISERLKNVLRNENGHEINSKNSISISRNRNGNEPSRASFLIKSRERVKSMSEFPNFLALEGNKTGSADADVASADVTHADASPRSLVRSFSAPVSGTTLGKLLLEDQRLTSRAHLRAKHESADETVDASKEVRKSRREHSFNFKNRVSYLKQNFNLRGKIFGKKTTHSVKSRPNSVEFQPLKVIKTIPSALMNCGVTQENYTEVPPSPASVSSSSHNEFSGADFPSPVSPLEIESHNLNSKIQELSQTDEVKNEESEESTFAEKSENNETIELETPDKTYIREILLAARLYGDKNSEKPNKSSDFALRSLSFQIFEELEESYNKERKFVQIDNEITIDHRILFDLANESLQSLFGPMRNSCTLNEWIVTGDELLQGKELLDQLIDQINIYRNPPMDQMQTIDSMVSRDVKLDSWTSKLYDEKDILVKKVTGAIFGELIDDFMLEICSNSSRQ